MAEYEDQPNVRKLRQCYYELLNIEMDASEEEIRQAYKYQALRWHPDKNRSDPETAAAMFLEVQQAYAVLSDAKKRAWYDRFRDKILQGNEEIVDDSSIDLEEYMTSACYEGFGDDEGGFYSVYRRVFEELMREELPYEDEEDPTPPGFGDSTTPYEQVHTFYSFWTAFATKKTFDHLMKYHVLEAPNRRTLRAMEKENVKIREAARRERNESVRRLVAFIRKRDKRVAKRRNEMNAINESNRQKTQAERQKRLQARRKDLEESAQAGESEWTSMKTLERSLAALERRYEREQQAAAAAADGKRGRTAAGEEDDNEEDDILILSDAEEQEEGDQANGQSNGDSRKDAAGESSDEETVDPGNMFCVACDKRFKSRPAFENHCRSKKHGANVEALKQALLQDDSLLS